MPHIVRDRDFGSADNDVGLNTDFAKFSDTLLNKNYYEMLRLFSNELEKENALLVVNGFSFRDEHILDLVKRSMVNPSLKILLFLYGRQLHNCRWKLGPL